MKVQQGSLTQNSQKITLSPRLFLKFYPDIFRLNDLDIISATKIIKTLKFNIQWNTKIQNFKKVYLGYWEFDT